MISIQPVQLKTKKRLFHRTESISTMTDIHFFFFFIQTKLNTERERLDV